MHTDDIVSTDPDKRDWNLWYQVGEHHGQACIARLHRSDPLPERDHISYLSAALAGIVVEMKRTKDTNVEGYWAGYAHTLMDYGMTGPAFARQKRRA